MIKFFRKIRYDLVDKNNIGNYLKYAIGEIVLVVIGILIALFINSTYNEYAEQKVEKTILRKLLLDIDSDYKQLNKVDSYYEKHLKDLIIIKNDFFKNKNDSIIISNIQKGYSGADIQDFNPRETTFDEMVYSGKLYNLSNSSLTDLCISYYEAIENNTYEVRQNRVEYRNVSFESQMNEYWLLFFESMADRENTDIIKSFVENKNTVAYKILKQNTGWSVIIIKHWKEETLELTKLNRNLRESLVSEINNEK